MSLPPPSHNQHYFDVSALDAGTLHMHLAQLVDPADDDDMTDLPVLAFLLQHSHTREKLLFDLGIRHDVHNCPSGPRAHAAKLDITCTGRDLGSALARGGLDPVDVNRVFLSHIHFDHVGDPALFPSATFVLGAGGREIIKRHGPHFDGSFAGVDVPFERATFLDMDAWPSLGPFPHALDWYGDRSLYVVDAPGHVSGHINLLVRTSPDGGWVYLAGDSAHDWRLLSGARKIPHHPRFGCTHQNSEDAEENIKRINKLRAENPRVKIILAHDAPWVEANKGGKAYWPGKIVSL